MGDEHDRCIERRELLLEPFEALDVEVVRGLVEQEQVGLDGERPREGGPRELAAGEGLELPVEIRVAKAEPSRRACRMIAPAPAARVLEPRLRVGVAAERLLVVGTAGHLALELTQLFLQREQVSRAGEHVLPERQLAISRRPLVVQGDTCAFREREVAALERGLA